MSNFITKTRGCLPRPVDPKTNRKQTEKSNKLINQNAPTHGSPPVRPSGESGKQHHPGKTSGRSSNIVVTNTLWTFWKLPGRSHIKSPMDTYLRPLLHLCNWVNEKLPPSEEIMILDWTYLCWSVGRFFKWPFCPLQRKTVGAAECYEKQSNDLPICEGFGITINSAWSP